MGVTPRQLSAITFAGVAAVCIARGHTVLGAVVALTLATSLVVHRPRRGYTGADRSICDALDPLLCRIWFSAALLQLCRNWVAASAACLVVVALCFTATRMLPYRSCWREVAHVGMHLAAGFGTVALVWTPRPTGRCAAPTARPPPGARPRTLRTAPASPRRTPPDRPRPPAAAEHPLPSASSVGEQAAASSSSSPAHSPPAAAPPLPPAPSAGLQRRQPRASAPSAAGSSAASLRRPSTTSGGSNTASGGRGTHVP